MLTNRSPTAQDERFAVQPIFPTSTLVTTYNLHLAQRSSEVSTSLLGRPRRSMNDGFPTARHPTHRANTNRDVSHAKIANSPHTNNLQILENRKDGRNVSR
jgi:hypothetical protein